MDVITGNIVVVYEIKILQDREVYALGLDVVDALFLQNNGRLNARDLTDYSTF